MDSLSIIITILEGLIVGSVVIAGLFAFKKLLGLMKFMPKTIEVAFSIVFSGFYLLVLVIDVLVDFIEKWAHILSKSLQISIVLVKMVVINKYTNIKESFDSKRYSIKTFVHQRLYEKGSPGIRVFSEDSISSQSFLKISPIILQ